MKIENVRRDGRKFIKEIIIEGERLEVIGKDYRAEPIKVEEICDIFGNGKVTITFELTHTEGEIIDRKPEEEMSERCDLCDYENAMVLKDGEDVFRFCPNHLIAFADVSLKPDEYKKLVKDHPKNWWLHEDFYDEEGNALQPRGS